MGHIKETYHETLFNDQLKLIKNMSKTQLLVTLGGLSDALKEDFDSNYRLLKQAVEVGLTWK